MIEVGTLDVRGGAFGDGTQLLDGGFTAAALKSLVAFAQCFGDGAGQGFPGFPGDSLGEPVGFGVLDIEAHLFLSSYTNVYILYRTSVSRPTSGVRICSRQTHDPL
jgi:hypothetical protein